MYADSVNKFLIQLDTKETQATTSTIMKRDKKETG
jgi:hypothetical protein